MYFEELNVPQNHIYLFKPHSIQSAIEAKHPIDGADGVLV